MRSVFDDQVMPVAETATSHGSTGGCPQWRRAVWASLPPLIQQGCLSSVAARTLKRKQVESSITPELESFARALFAPCHEASLIRPLCLMLEFARVKDGSDLRAGGWQRRTASSRVHLKGPSCYIRGRWRQAPRSTRRFFEPSEAANTIRTILLVAAPRQHPADVGVARGGGGRPWAAVSACTRPRGCRGTAPGIRQHYSP